MREMEIWHMHVSRVKQQMSEYTCTHHIEIFENIRRIGYYECLCLVCVSTHHWMFVHTVYWSECCLVWNVNDSSNGSSTNDVVALTSCVQRSCVFFQKRALSSTPIHIYILDDYCEDVETTQSGRMGMCVCVVSMYLCAYFVWVFAELARLRTFFLNLCFAAAVFYGILIKFIRSLSFIHSCLVRRLCFFLLYFCMVLL